MTNSNLLTTAIVRDYSLPVAAKKAAIGIGLLSNAAMSRNVSRSAVFLRLALPFMGGIDGEPQGSPVRVPGSPTRLLPPTRLDSSVRFTKLNGERIMTTPSISTSATPNKISRATGAPRPRRKTKSVAPTVYPLTRYELEHRSRNIGLKELTAYIASLTEEEKRVIGHVCPFGDPYAGMQEMRRLLGESIAKCKIIPFPVGGKRGVQIAKEA